MVPNIGQDVLLDGKKLVHVQDLDNLEMMAKVGPMDANGIVWDTEWVCWDRCIRI
jgi:hypothetical protein